MNARAFIVNELTTHRKKCEISSSNKYFQFLFSSLRLRTWETFQRVIFVLITIPKQHATIQSPIIDGQNANAILCHPSYGAIFGKLDLSIYANANTNQSSNCSCLGLTYQAPVGYQYNTPRAQSLFAGSKHFTPTELSWSILLNN